ncbi:multicopper oxidase domain-containing protein [Streptomyces anulatus]|uniref:Multicopper oxidase domain-containing protein n=1 Tax=Streptomyces anulatus TaxID=1892 RepID=A0ABZ1ZIR0_STRAQ|nr:multicopper oxidase domain-containing protein [Streptomyces anulatus]
MEKTRGRRRLKRVLITLAVVVGVLGAAVDGSFAWLWTSTDISTVGKARFGNALAVPPLAPSTVDKDGTRVFDLRMPTGRTEFRPGVATPTWGFNGGHLGPTLRAERGERMKVQVRNTLDEASSGAVRTRWRWRWARPCGSPCGSTGRAIRTPRTCTTAICCPMRTRG